MIGLTLALSAAAVWWATHRSAAATPPPTGKVESADITHVVQAAGVLQARTRVDVGAQVSGQIRKIHVQLGQQVRKDDLLVSLDPELARSDVAQSEAALAQARAALDRSKVDAEAARREVARQHRLLAASATAAAEAERAETDLARIEADQRGQAAQLSRLQAELDTRRLKLSYTRITAPMNGIVVSLPAQEGQTVIAVQVTPVLLTLADLDIITVRTRVAEADVGQIRVGQAARFTTLAGESRRFEGKLRVIQPIPERAGNAVFYNVLFEVDNRDRQLLSDMTVQVDIEVGAVKQVPALPVVSLGARDRDGRYTVHVQGPDGQGTPRKVRVGLQDGARAQVLEGLAVGDRVLLAPPPDAALAASTPPS